MKKLLSLLLAVSLLLALPVPSSAKDTAVVPEIRRFSGKSRYETSVEISKEVYDRANTVVIASGENFPDGLTGGVLASGFDGPLLLSGKKSVPKVVLDEVKRLRPEKIYILGGTGSLSEKVDGQLSAVAKTRRIEGKDRHETALEVAKVIRKKFPSKHFGLAGSGNFADSLASTALLARDKIALLLTPKDQLPEDVHAFMKENASNLLLFGGVSQISNDIRQKLTSDFSLTSFSGEDRFKTAYEIARNGFSNTNTVILANGNDFPDALSAAPLAAKYEAPILLTSPDKISKETLSLCAKADLVLIAGGNTAVNEEIEDRILEARNSSSHEILDIADVNEIVVNYYGRKERVKLIGVEAPMISSDHLKAGLVNETFRYLDGFKGKTVTLQMDIRQRDQKGRLLAYVYFDDSSRMLNSMLLEKGYLVFKSSPPNIKHDEYLKGKEEEAEEAGAGYWGLFD